MSKSYRHLTYGERCQIIAYKRSNISNVEIARQLGVHRSSIGRELKRNRSTTGYCPDKAETLKEERRHKASSTPLKMIQELIELIESKLYIEWSPVQISGWLKERNQQFSVSHERIYQHIWQDKKAGGKLFRHLRHRGKKYNKRGKGTAGRGCIPNRVDIDQRPKIAELKQRVGDWELDTIIGCRQQGALVSMVDRASKLTKLAKIPAKLAQCVNTVMLMRLEPIKDFVLTMTADNGKEFAGHEEIAAILGAGFYFAKPYHSWERGLNEHTNGLVRQYFPKGTNFLTVTHQQVQHVENLLNNRPRKVLNFKTPLEMFESLTKKIPTVALHC
jgi:transposase, IS30 family